ncbi:MAG: asparagine--tRNA ligase [Gammaproteobacteria bacterium]|nr:asparagine--tRNA ligase [Gammaproteobacteria bacterium]
MTADLLAGKVALDSIVTVCGWVRTRRDSKAGVSFIALSDGSGFKPIQVVAASTLANYKDEILKLTTGCAINVIGKLIQSPAQGQDVELQAETIEVTGWVEDPDTYPISPKYHTLEYLREYAHLRPRTNVIGAVTRVRHCLSMAIHRFFHERGFYWIHTPIITSSDCEGAGQMLRVTSLDLEKIPLKPDGKIDFGKEFFARETFLTVSGQLNLEAYCEALTKVYTFGPTFRAENSNTSLHLAEFWMVEPEIAFADLNDNASLAADMIRYLAKAVLDERKDDMQFFAERIDKDCINRLKKIVNSEFVRMEYTEAVEHLKKAKKKFEFPVGWGLDLQSEHERYLTEELIHGPVVLMNYPKEIKSFYMRMNDDGKTVAAMDVLVPGIGEIIGGSQREERYDVICARMDELGLNKEIYKWYLDLRRYGSVPHSGYGLGLERMIMYVTGIQNIRDTIPFPRVSRHAEY